MKLFKKRTIALALALAAALFAGCRTEFEGEVEGEFADDGVKTEVGISASAEKVSGWQKFYAYAYAYGANEALGAWPGTELTALTGDYAGYYATYVTGIGTTEYSLIFNNGTDQLADVKFTKGGSWLYNADGDWSDGWRFDTTVVADDPEEESDEVIDLSTAVFRGLFGNWDNGNYVALTEQSDGTYTATFTATAASTETKIGESDGYSNIDFGGSTAATPGGAEVEWTWGGGQAGFSGMTVNAEYKVTFTPRSLTKILVKIEATGTTGNTNTGGGTDTATANIVLPQAWAGGDASAGTYLTLISTSATEVVFEHTFTYTSSQAGWTNNAVGSLGFALQKTLGNWDAGNVWAAVSGTAAEWEAGIEIPIRTTEENAKITSGLTADTTYTMTITVSLTDGKVKGQLHTGGGNSIMSVSTLYISGDAVGGWTEPGAEGSKAFTKSGDVYTLNLEVTDETGISGKEFKIYNGSGWNNTPAYGNANITAGSINILERYDGTGGNAKLTLAKGSYTLVVMPGKDSLYLSVVPTVTAGD